MRAYGVKFASTLAAGLLLAGLSATANATFIPYSYDGEGEAFYINVPTYWWETENPWSDDLSYGDNLFWNASGDEFGGWSLAGLLTLNLTGTHTVTVSSVYGDFWFGSSRLDARRYRAVPEPGTLALLAIGLIGMGVALSRRRNQK